MDAEVEKMRDLGEKILDLMGDERVTEENFEKLKTINRRLDERIKIPRAEIASLREQLTAANQTIKGLEDDLDSVREALRKERKKNFGLRVDVDDLQEKVKVLEERVVSLEADLNT
jgi:chromosome segregation ATPase